GAFLQQQFDQPDGRGFADIIRASFESQTQCRQALALERPERAAHLAQKPPALLFVDADYFIEQAEVVSHLARHRSEGLQVFGETRAPISDARIQESPADAGV